MPVPDDAPVDADDDVRPVDTDANNDGPVDADDDVKPSRAEQRALAAAYAELAEELVKRGTPNALPDPPFGGTLLQSVVDACTFKKSARGRQLRRLAQELRRAGPIEDIRDALSGRTLAMRAQQRREQSLESWRSRLINEGDEALAEFMAQYPSADATRLRQLMRVATQPVPDRRAKKAATALIRELRLVTTDEASTS